MVAMAPCRAGGRGHAPAGPMLLVLLASLAGAACGPEASDGAPPVDEVLEELASVEWPELLDASFLELVRRDPELATELGLSSRLEIGDAALTDISPRYSSETRALEAGILDLVERVDPSQLAPAARRSHDVYVWYLRDLVAGHPYGEHVYLLSPAVNGVQNQLFLFLRDLHPVRNRHEAQSYVTRLWGVHAKLDQAAGLLRDRAQRDIVPPRLLLQIARTDLERRLLEAPVRSELYEAFAVKLASAAGVRPESELQLLREAARAIAGSVQPGIQALVDAIEDVMPLAPVERGASELPDGCAYYAWTLRHHTTTALGADEIHALGISEVDRIGAQMRARFAELGYAGASLPQLFAQLAAATGYVSGDDIARHYEDLITAATARLGGAFDGPPPPPVTVIAGEEGSYYVAPSLDGSRPGRFYARVGGREARYAMPTLAYHEAVPGHHLQLSRAAALDLPLARRVVGFNAYVEGWALYAERLAAELGWYADDPAADLGRLQAEAFRAARLVVDTGLHARGWTYPRAVDYMVENVGFSEGAAGAEVARYLAWPGQATSYAVGMQELLRVRDTAQAADLRSFHGALLGLGSVPLELLESMVLEELAARSSPSR